MLTNAKSVHKIEAIQKRALRFMLNDYESSYEDLLKKSGNSSMNLRRTRSLCIETYKTINSLNPGFVKNQICKANRLTGFYIMPNKNKNCAVHLTLTNLGAWNERGIMISFYDICLLKFLLCNYRKRVCHRMNGCNWNCELTQFL